MLLEMGFTADLVDTAVEVYAADRMKALEFCKSYVAIRQMGFPELRIKEALLLHDTDKERATTFLLDESNRGFLHAFFKTPKIRVTEWEKERRGLNARVTNSRGERRSSDKSSIVPLRGKIEQRLV